MICKLANAGDDAVQPVEDVGAAHYRESATPNIKDKLLWDPALNSFKLLFNKATRNARKLNPYCGKSGVKRFLLNKCTAKKTKSSKRKQNETPRAEQQKQRIAKHDKRYYVNSWRELKERQRLPHLDGVNNPSTRL